MELFFEQLKIVDDLFSEVRYNNKRCICFSERKEDATWCLIFTDLRKVWHRTLDYKDIEKHTKLLGFPNQDNSLKHYFQLFLDAFTSDNIFVSDFDKETLTLTLWCFISGKQIPFKYNLPFVSSKTLTLEYIEKVTFSLLEKAKSARQIERENETLKQKLSSIQQNNFPSQNEIDLSPTIEHTSKSNQSNIQPVVQCIISPLSLIILL